MNQAPTAGSDINAWLERLQNATTDEERLFYLSRIQALDPQNERAAQLVAQNMKRYLRKQPLLAYLEEDEHLYRVRTGDDLILAVAKDRAQPEAYSPGRFGPFGPAYRSVMWAVVALVLAPLALFFGILAILAALRAAFVADGPARNRTLVIVLIALFLVLPAGAALTYLLWLHIVG